MLLDTAFVRQVGIKYPIIGGAMYPCSNPELVAAVSRAGGVGVVQPISLTYAHGHDFRTGLQHILALSGGKPIGMNLLIEKGSKIYLERNRQWLHTALEEGVRFFITALGDPRWVVDIAHAHGAVVYHDVTERKWAEKAVAGGVDGLICVNNRAGGHAGTETPVDLLLGLRDLDVPLVCAGGIGSPASFAAALEMGYDAVQLGTRFIASDECTAHADYKQAILQAGEDDIVQTRKMTGVPVAIINTESVARRGTEPGRLAEQLLAADQTKHWARLFYSLRSVWELKRSLKEGSAYKDYFQAGKSVQDIDSIESVATIVDQFVAAAQG